MFEGPLRHTNFVFEPLLLHQYSEFIYTQGYLPVVNEDIFQVMVAIHRRGRVALINKQDNVA